MRHPLLHKIRTLTIALIVSGGLNITLIGVSAYWMLKERPPTPYCELKPASSHDRQAPLALDTNNKEVIRYFKLLPLPQLAAKLHDARLVENGYTERDLALGCMAAFHHFDVIRALANTSLPQQKRHILFTDDDGSTTTIPLFRPLTDEQFTTIIRFYETEQWPLTSEGLFLALKDKKENHNPTLLYTFHLTEEFLALETLLHRADTTLTKEEIVALALDGDWKTLHDFSIKQKQSQDLSDARRQKLLLDYLDQNSTSAALILLKTDPTFSAKKLDDIHILQMLKLMTERSAAATRFALAMLMSPRSDNVWQEAAARLYEYVGEPKPQQYHRNVVLARFVPLAVAPKDPVKEQIALPTPPKPVQIAKPLSKPAPPPPPKKVAIAATTPPKPKMIQRSYTVKEGDTLWKISRRFNIDINTLKKINRLNEAPLKPGTILSIPSAS